VTAAGRLSRRKRTKCGPWSALCRMARPRAARSDTLTSSLGPRVTYPGSPTIQASPSETRLYYVKIVTRKIKEGKKLRNWYIFVKHYISGLSGYSLQVGNLRGTRAVRVADTAIKDLKQVNFSITLFPWLMSAWHLKICKKGSYFLI
jgi:hypothetical protein